MPETAPERWKMIEAAAEPTAPSRHAELFYAEALRELAGLGLPFLLAGSYAVSAYTGISRATKDLDIFCKPGDYPIVLSKFPRARLRDRDRGRALARQGPQGGIVLRRDFRRGERHHGGGRRVVRARPADRGVRHARAHH